MFDVWIMNNGWMIMDDYGFMDDGKMGRWTMDVRYDMFICKSPVCRRAGKVNH